MSSWYSRLPSWSDKISPFGRSSTKNGTAEVSDADFSYITAEDLAREGANKGSTSGEPGSHDVLVLKHKRLSYPLHFPSGSIDRGQVKIGQIRAEAAKRLELPTVEAERIKLLYRGKNLKDDHRTAREEGLSSSAQSELMVVMGDALPKGDDSSSEGEAEDGAEGGSTDAAKKKKNRKRKTRRKNKGDGSGTATPTTSYTNAKIDPDATYAPSSAPPPRSAPPARAPAKPQTALEKLDTLSSTFHTKYVPDCIQFLSNPPADKAKLQYDQKRFSETILAQILLKLDAVETEGDPVARQRRKDLVREVQNILNKLDEIGR